MLFFKKKKKKHFLNQFSRTGFSFSFYSVVPIFKGIVFQMAEKAFPWEK